MGTRSAIGIKHGDRIKAVYCHWDGYIEHNGAILIESYTSSVKVNKLIAMGDLSSLGDEIGVKHEFSPIGLTPEEKEQFEVEHGNSCTFYGRDRGEEAVDFKSFDSEAAFIDHYDGCGAEFYYLFDNGVWYVSAYKEEFKPLHEEVARVCKEEA